MSCHRAAFKDVLSPRLAPHQFGVEKSIEDISLEEIFKTMYSNDFNEPDATAAVVTTNSVDEISFEDRKFVNIVENKTSKKDYHYVVSSPFRDGRLIMPNNRGQTIKRPMLIRQRLLKDQNFFGDYKKFMENLLVKGYENNLRYCYMGKLGIFYIIVYTTQLSETSSAWYSIAVLGFKENPSMENFYQNLI